MGSGAGKRGKKAPYPEGAGLKSTASVSEDDRPSMIVSPAFGRINKTGVVGKEFFRGAPTTMQFGLATFQAGALRGKAKFAGGDKSPPRVCSALKRAHAGDALLFQQQRRTGAGRLVGSTAKENDFAVARHVAEASLQIVDRGGDGPDHRIPFLFRVAAQIDDQHLFAGFE